MIRIEGIPIVAARLAASLKTAKSPETAQVFHQTQRTPSTKPSATYECAGLGRMPECA